MDHTVSFKDDKHYIASVPMIRKIARLTRYLSFADNNDVVDFIFLNIFMRSPTYLLCV